MTFKDLYISLLDYVDRSPIVLLPQAKRAINEAIMWANRAHMFKRAERLVVVTYPANEFLLDLSVSCDTEIYNVISAQVIPDATTRWGRTIPIIDYSRLSAQRFNHNRKTPSGWSNEIPESNVTHDQALFTINGTFGLHPTPTTDVHLLLQVNAKLPQLVAPTDKNFFTEYAADFILSKALLSKFLVYVPKERVELLSKEMLLTEWESVVSWDKQLRNAENFFESL